MSTTTIDFSRISNVKNQLKEILSVNFFNTQDFSKYPLRFQKISEEGRSTKIVWTPTNEYPSLPICCLYSNNSSDITAYVDDQEISVKSSFDGCQLNYELGKSHIFTIYDDISSLAIDDYNDVYSGRPPKFANITDVRIGKNVKRLRKNCFAGSNSLSNVQGIENVQYIESHAFYNTQNLKIGINALNLLSSDQHIFRFSNISSFNAPKLEYSYSNLLNNCPNLLSVYIPRLKNVGRYFLAYDVNLKYVDMNESTNIGYYLLDGTTSHQNIILDFTAKKDGNIPLLEHVWIESVGKYYDTFGGCSANVSVMIPNDEELYQRWINADLWKDIPDNIKIIKGN